VPFDLTSKLAQFSLLKNFRDSFHVAINITFKSVTVTVRSFKRIKEVVMVNIIEVVKIDVHTIIALLPILSFVPAFLILYYLHAWTFQQTYIGRTFLLIFLWLVVLEIILSWRKLQKNKVNKLRSIRTALFVIALLLPTIYVVAANYYGINTIIMDLTSRYIAPFTYLGQAEETVTAQTMPISFEYLVFAAFLCLTILLAYGISTLADFSLSIAFPGIIGLLFTMSLLYPEKLTPLQIFVPATAILSAKVLTLMGYHTSLYLGTSMPLLTATNRFGQSFTANIDWTCAGVESLIIYTVLILLFLRQTIIPWKYKIIYFAIGAAVTYFINTLRIATLFVLGIEYGGSSPIWQNFHNYYAMLYSVGWIVSYPLIIIGSQALWAKIRHSKTRINRDEKNLNFSTQSKD
jgi:exosortase/archaeosortase family protein